ncbi:MAG: potassium-transporting ATPase subunit KdpB [Acidimicrobiales bacterium]
MTSGSLTSRGPHNPRGAGGSFGSVAWQALAKFDPRQLVHNPVIFVVTIGTVVSAVSAIQHPSRFAWSMVIVMALTIFFANVAESSAEGRGRAQAAALRGMRTEAQARRLSPDGREELVASSELSPGDMVVCEPGDQVPSDGEITDGIASVDESAITGESAPVIREAGGDRSAVTGGTTVLSDRIMVRITAAPGETFLDRMIGLVEGANRQKTPNELALTVLLVTLTIVFVPVVAVLEPYSAFAHGHVLVITLVGLLVCLIPTTIGALMSAIGIAGMDRLVQRNVLAMSGRAVEAAGDVTTLLLDKTGTITFGNRRATELVPAGDHGYEELARAAYIASLADETPEGRSIVALTEAVPRVRDPQGAAPAEGQAAGEPRGEIVEFSAHTRMSGVDLQGRRLRKGAADAVLAWVSELGGTVPAGVREVVEEMARSGSTPLVVADGNDVLGVIELKDVVKEGIAERFAHLRRMAVRTVMITGDNPLTAAAIAAEAGVDDYLAEATPEMKLERIKAEQRGGRLIAMTGDGTNDAPALAQADVGVAMNTGTMAAKEAGNMIDLDSDPTKLMDIVEIGKQLLVTRGSLTTFSIANDVAKYFAIIPAMFVATYPQLHVLNVMHLHSPDSAVLSAVIFNAVIILALIPLALKGVRVRARSATALLRRNVLIYGLGGIVIPFIGIKLIDMLLTLARWP